MSEKPLTYADAGVDIDKANRLVETIRGFARQTARSGVMGEIGGFGGLFSTNFTHMENPVLVSSTDGVGTKLKIAFMMNKHDTVGIDLVGMCVNDILVMGAKPLFFLDYLSMGTLDTEIVTDLVKGVSEGCKEAGCALIGGETAEMPGFYGEREYDMAGFAVGVVDNSKIIDGSDIRAGHKLVGIPSDGLHSNGFSLVRKICFDMLNLKQDTHMPEFDRTLGEELLRPTRIYAKAVQVLTRDLPVHGLAHITGGGIAENIVRVIPDACGIKIYQDSWEVPRIFTFLQQAGNISDGEMMRTFNNGIGMVLVVHQDVVPDVLQRLSAMNEDAAVIGEVVRRKGQEARVVWANTGNAC
ncbi:MAG: phosphoribosylformylglycinamidine cyclo-ligase [Desulfobacteraceae bacterium 4572_88]|nr:MAG: phosphoribosylformylglycinamidine cyclo-ligase [Desulfobacteraceae bacterium 4572_88]